jgi:hypothetical protein
MMRASVWLAPGAPDWNGALLVQYTRQVGDLSSPKLAIEVGDSECEKSSTHMVEDSVPGPAWKCQDWGQTLQGTAVNRPSVSEVNAF